MRNAGYRLAQLAAAGTIVGGAFDLSVRELMPHHAAFLGVPVGQVPAATAALLLLLLHTLGVALIAVGVAALALLEAWRRSGIYWAALVAAAAIAGVQLVNAWAISRAGSPLFLGPLAFAVLAVGGVLMAGRHGRNDLKG